MPKVKTKDKVFYYSGYTQFENTGDLLINKTLLDIVSSNGSIVVNDKNMPIDYKNALLNDINNIVKFSELAIEKSFTKVIFLALFKNFIFRNKEIFILENPGHHMSKLIKPGKNQYKELLIKNIQKKLNCKILKIGVTLGPYSNSMGVFSSIISKFYYSILVRDFKTLDLANNFNFKNVSYIPDLAWAYNHEKFIEKTAISIPQTKYFVISFRDAMEGKVRDFEYYNQLQNSIEQILITNSEYKIVLSYQVEFDRIVCKDLFALFGTKYDITFIDKCLSISDAMYLYSKSEMVISNRLHVLLLAIKAGTLPIAITNVDKHFKLVSMFYDENVKECVFDVSSDNLINLLKEIINKRQIVLNKFEIIVKKNSDLIISGIKQIFKS